MTDPRDRSTRRGQGPGPAPATYYHHARAARAVAARPPLAGRLDAEVCVVGGGLAGLAAALSLAGRGLPPVLLEAGRVGDGASGRNGGIASAGLARDAASLARAAGPAAARELLRLALGGLRLLRRRADASPVPCALAEGVVVAARAGPLAALRAGAERSNRDLGTRLEAWPRERLAALYRSPLYRGGLFDPDGFHLDPLALCEGHAAAAEALGARVHEGTPALSLERAGAGFRLRTPLGEVRAARVVLCQSAYAPAGAAPLLPRLARATLPVASYVLVTEPLGAPAAEAVRAPHAVYDDRFATGYFRLLPGSGGRLLWGGGVSLSERPPAAFVPALLRDLAAVFPPLAGARADFAWSGRMGFARHRMPLVAELAPGLWAATCLGGHGLNTATLAGELVARALAEADLSWRPLLAPFAPAWAGGPLGRLAAAALIRGHALDEALRGAWPGRPGRD